MRPDASPETGERQVAVALFNAAALYGGSEKRTIAMAGELLRRGHRPVAVVRPGSILERRCGEACLPARTLRLSRQIRPLHVLSVARMLKRGGFDHVIALTQRTALYTAVASLFVPRRPGLICYYSVADMFHTGSRLKSLVGRRFDCFVANARSTHDELSRLEWIPTAKARLVYDGVSLPSVEAQGRVRSRIRREMGLPEDAVVVLLAMRLFKHKRQAEFLQSARIVLEHSPQVHVWIAGDGPESARLHAERAALTCGERVRLLGFRDDVLDLMAGADILCHPSSREGAPNAVREAMAAGLPVLASAADGTAELVVDGETGRLFPVEDLAGLVETLREWIRDPATRHRLGASGRRVAEERFSEAACCAHWLRIMDEIGQRV